MPAPVAAGGDHRQGDKSLTRLGHSRDWARYHHEFTVTREYRGHARGVRKFLPCVILMAYPYLAETTSLVGSWEEQMKLSWLAVAGLVVGSSPAGAQAPPPPAPGAAPPAQLAPAKPFALALALEAAQAALASCQAGGPAVVEVMDSAFNPKVVLAGDGARANFVDFARRKAYTVIKTGMSSAEFGTSVGPQPRGAGPINGDANLITFGGALPIKVGSDIVAAISVSGPNGPAADETCAKAGLAKISDRLK